MTRTVIALFDNFTDANDSVRELVDNGFAREDISLMANDARGEYGKVVGGDNPSGASEGAGVGAGIGAVIGGVGGLLLGLGALAIPGIGPVIAAGPLAAALTGLAGAGAGAVAGGIAGGLLGALVDMGVPEEAANYYAEGVRRGGTLLTVRSADHMSDQAVSILNRHNPIDVNKRAEDWRREGWTRFDPDATPYETNRDILQSETTDFERQHDFNTSAAVPVTGDDDEVNRTLGPGGVMGTTYGDDVSSGSHRGYGSGDTQMGRDTEIGDRGIHDKDIRDSGSGFDATSQRQGGDYDAMLRNQGPSGVDASKAGYSSQDASGEYGDVFRKGAAGTDAPYGAGSTNYKDYSLYDSSFRNHFATSMYASDYTYDQFQPAYRYGYDLATDQRYHGRDWRDIELDAQRDWDTNYPGTWDRFKDSIRHAWQEIKDTVS